MASTGYLPVQDGAHLHQRHISDNNHTEMRETAEALSSQYGEVDDGESLADSTDEYGPLSGGRLYNPMSGVEDLEKYRPGGFYPLQINDEIHGGGFTIVHKLGYGGFSTVWLARDKIQEKYVAIRISTAENFKDENTAEEIYSHLKAQSQRNLAGQLICLPLQHFTVESPNGKHRCTVFSVCGPSIAQITEANNTRSQGPKIVLSPQEVQRAALQTTQAVAFLHSEEVGVGHGDLSSSNILLDIGNLDHLSVDQLYQVIGYPEKYPIQPLSDEPQAAWAPHYIYNQVDTMKLFSHRSGNIRLVDFGSAFKTDSPPEELGIPTGFRSPELILHNYIGKEGDIWALACVIMEMRGCGMMFESFMDDDREVLQSMRYTLGAFPPSVLNDDRLSLGLDQPPRADLDYKIRDRLLDFAKSILVEPRPVRDYDYYDSGNFVQRGVKQLWGCVKWAFSWRPWQEKGLKKELQPAIISVEEAESLSDLLVKALAYEVEKRLTAEQMLGHPWFSKVFAKPSLEVWEPTM